MRKEWDVTTMACRFTAACTGTSGEFRSVYSFYGTNVTEILYIYFLLNIKCQYVL